MPVVEAEGGRGKRTLWIALAIVCAGCLLLLGIVAILLPVYGRAKASAERITCMAHMDTLHLAICMYLRDHDGRLPEAATWRDSLAEYVTDAEAWQCPSDPAKHPSSYAFNPNLSGLAGTSLTHPARIVLLFESASADPNPSDPAAWPSPERHRVSGAGVRGSNVAYVDGRVETKVNLQASDLEAALRPAP